MPVHLLMRCLHHPGKGAEREAARAAHRDWVRSGGEGLARVLVGAALVDAEGAPVGNFGILEAADEASARAFAEGDPYARAGIVASIDLTRLSPGFEAHRIAEPMTPAP